MLENKKSSILLILKTLEEYSDEEHFLTHQDIIDRIEQDYGITLERKSVAYSISLLQELDYDIEKGPRGGYALYSRLFDDSEVGFLTDAVFSSKAIPGKQAIELSKKIQSVLSRHKRKSYAYIHKSPKLTRAQSSDVFYAIDMVHEGISLGKRISFQYLSYDEQGNQVPRNDGFRYIVSPYYLVSSNGFYYLICNYREKYRPIQVFRVDLMRNIAIEPDWPIKPLSSLKGAEEFDLSEYLNEHIYLLGGESVEAVLRVDSQNGIQYLKDWFGDKAHIRHKEDGLYAEVRCNEASLLYWILQYGDDFTLLEPTSLVNRLREHLARQTKKYGGTQQ